MKNGLEKHTAILFLGLCQYKLKLLDFLFDFVLIIYYGVYLFADLFIHLFNYSFIYLSKGNFTNKIGAVIFCFIPSVSCSFPAEEENH